MLNKQTIYVCDYCGRRYKLDEDRSDNPPWVFGESKCRTCGKEHSVKKIIVKPVIEDYDEKTP